MRIYPIFQKGKRKAFALVLLILWVAACRPGEEAVPTFSPATPPMLHPGWTSYTNANDILDVLLDRQGNIWAAGSGGVVKWDRTSGTYTKYTAEHGLPGNNVRALVQAPDGAIWFATRSGVARFDGREWKTFTEKDGLVHNTTWSAAAAPDGTMWFGTYRGISRFDGIAWTTSLEYYDMVASMAIAADGHVWAGMREGLPGSSVFEFDGTSWTHHVLDQTIDGDVERVATTPDGAVWADTWDGSKVYDGLGWSLSSRPGNFVGNDAPANDANGGIWFYEADQLSRFDGRRWKKYSLPPTWSGDLAPTAVILAPDKRPWVGTPLGLARPSGSTYTLYTTGDRLIGNYVWMVAATPDGAVWFYAHGGRDLEGVSRFDGQNWTTYTQADGLPPGDVSAIVMDSRGVLWFGMQDDLHGAGGLFRFDGKIWASSTGLLGNDVQALAIASDGALWAGTVDGLSRFDGTSLTAFSEITGVRAIATTPDGAVWVGSKTGVSRLDATGWATLCPSPAYGSIDSLAVAPDGTFWAGAGYEGALYFDGQNCTLYSQEFGLPGHYVSAVVRGPDGATWFGTDRGVARFDGRGWTYYTAADGLAEDHVTSIAVGADGALWFGTLGGVSRYWPSK